MKSIRKKNPRAIILSGGPSSVFSDNAPDFDINILNTNIPILGICYGLHLLVQHNGGVVNSTGKGEYGLAEVEQLKKIAQYALRLVEQKTRDDKNFDDDGNIKDKNIINVKNVEFKVFDAKNQSVAKVS